mgnify:CR=1 FL=1
MKPISTTILFSSENLKYSKNSLVHSGKKTQFSFLYFSHGIIRKFDFLYHLYILLKNTSSLYNKIRTFLISEVKYLYNSLFYAYLTHQNSILVNLSINIFYLNTAVLITN